jgi:hypothetical protein
VNGSESAKSITSAVEIVEGIKSELTIEICILGVLGR